MPKHSEGGAFKGMYPLKGIPPELWERFTKVCDAESPPVSKRWVILELIKKFCNSRDTQVPAEPPKAKPTRKAKAPKVENTPTATVTAAGVPDLGSSF